MKGIYRYSFYSGRGGNISGIFVAEIDLVQRSNGKKVYFGEALGKHSNVEGNLRLSDFTLLSSEPADIEVFERLDLECGYNPFNYTVCSRCEWEYGEHSRKCKGDSSAGQ